MPRDGEYITRPQPGPQEQFLSSAADIVFYGGSAGGGKSAALLLESIRHVRNGQFGAVIFRRTYPEIFNEGSLWDTSFKIYPLVGGDPQEGKAQWVFPAGAKIKFSHMEHEKNKLDWNGSQIPLIGFDEITEFSETMFWYMLSRNRTTCGIRPYVRATCNPDADSWVAKLIAWWIDQRTGFPIPERSGVVRYFIRDSGQLYWGDTKAEIEGRFPGSIAKSLTFIPSKLSDNQILERLDPGYRASLMAMEHVERQRLLEGNWKVRPAAGLKFPRDKWITKFNAAPPGVRWTRFWDKAATEGGTGARTAGGLIGELASHLEHGLPRFWVGNVQAGRWGDAERESQIKSTAELDRKTYGNVPIGIEREGGSGGSHSTYSTINLLSGFDVYAERPTTNKAARWTPLATQQQVGNVAVVCSDDWDWDSMIRELDALAGDEQLDKNKLRDIADALSGGFKYLTGGSAPIDEFIASGDPLYDEEERKPFSPAEKAELPEFWRDLIDETDASVKERRGFFHRDDI